MIKIEAFFPNIKEEDLQNYKAHLAIGGKGRDNRFPLNEFVRGKFKEYQEGFQFEKILEIEGNLCPFCGNLCSPKALNCPSCGDPF